MPINDDTIKILKKAIADAFNAQLPKTLKGKARKKSIKGNNKMGNDLGNAIKGFLMQADVKVDLGQAFESGSVELTGTGATVPPDPMDTDVDPLAGDPVNVAIIASGSILGNIIEE